MRIFFLKIFILTCFLGLGGCRSSGKTENKSQEFSGKGTVVSADSENNIATIEHEEIKGLMSAMTMDFSAKDKNLLNDIEAGDVVEFVLERNGDDLILTKIKKTGRKVANGAEIFAQSCAKCHGKKGEGAKKGIPLIEGHALNHPEEDFLKQVKEGGEKMPEFGDKLSEEEIAAVVKFVRNEIQKGLRKESEGGHKH